VNGTADPPAYLTKKGFGMLTLYSTLVLSLLKGVAMKISLHMQPTANWKLKWIGKYSLVQILFLIKFF